ncbi:hypothetical protein NIIDMKKI_51340 [Mycobacterium kansasii]|uniref:Glutamyl/glutaminyl-tRNA synthetase class Ib catalytic domain-containing protein n=1 Tax=Mycobacterium kansasii TaxID=1768 RepID=A0A7G1IMP0_MYCKA|nr:hypothetical protein NIIDMKKI_51340 [Mycobacterium kansasii]
MVRTALFNWAYARHTGGTFVFRIEDTDAQRDSEESYLALLDALRWLGLNWDEGPEVGGPYGPYRQSQRREIYRDVIAQLLVADEAYYAFSTPEEVEARHIAAGRNPKLGYDNFDRHLTDSQRAAYLAEGRQPVVRLRMPDTDLSWSDLVRGPTTFAAGSVPDFALTRANGDPLYTLVNPCDDALMKITHVLRGEDLLPSTPRQLALYQSLIRVGIAERVPEFAHLPTVLGRAPRSSRNATRSRTCSRTATAASFPRVVELPCAARLVDRRRPRSVQPRRDGGGVRRGRRELESGAVRPEESRRPQRRAHPDARCRRLHPPAPRLP